MVFQKALLSPPYDLIVTWSRPLSDRSHSLQKRMCASEGGVAAAAAAVLDLPPGAHSLSLQRPRPPACVPSMCPSLGAMWLLLTEAAVDSGVRPCRLPARPGSVCLPVCLDPGLGRDADCPRSLGAFGSRVNQGAVPGVVGGAGKPTAFPLLLSFP